MRFTGKYSNYKEHDKICFYLPKIKTFMKYFLAVFGLFPVLFMKRERQGEREIRLALKLGECKMFYFYSSEKLLLPFITIYS